MKGRRAWILWASFAVVGVAACDGEPADRCPAGDCDVPGWAKVCSRDPGSICTIAGTGVAGDGADRLAAFATRLYLPMDVALGPDRKPIIIDWNNHRIRSIEHDGTMRVVAGAGELTPDVDDPESARLNHPTDVTFDGLGRMVIAAWHNSKIKRLDAETGELLDVCGTGKRGFSGDGGPADVAVLDLPVGVAFDDMGRLVIADQANLRLRRVDSSHVITTIAGSGVYGYAGDGGPAIEAEFRLPIAQAANPAGKIAADSTGNVYFADTGNSRIRRVDTTGIIDTFAGNGTRGTEGDGGPAVEAQLKGPVDVAVGPDGSLYIADTDNNCIRRVTAEGNIETVGGICGQDGFSGDGGPARRALLYTPFGIAVDKDGNVFVADTRNHRVRVIWR